MSWNKKLLLSTAVLIFSGAACAGKITCPNTLQNALITHRLNDASLFQGPPKNNGELMSDNDRHIVWTLKEYQSYAKKMSLPLWLVCRYENTSKTVELKVPDSANQCKAGLGENSTRFYAFCE
ncbi:hypothetical protein SMB93_000017 [Cronobacter sakazakii]|uniref:STY0301 family protein n=1 Tax=Cronobacter sakazakii TaxID=28141 RepID=UPI000CFDE855|nr:STY0301 family protein [Cronobacter sakazakii]ELQ6062201.1 hypothetical protein [Cronobacter sakazakii]ELY2469707.1 hypothetical protein [Cronobacter sakazakii]ELY3412233.1 hypothetical protein [Cronobacter sakazakii]ELY4417790.1 hypothetical protein [Cronobacter sakazakii]ELY4750352.1 hypothetical protein [Cronobacter sakazakii]